MAWACVPPCSSTLWKLPSHLPNASLSCRTSTVNIPFRHSRTAAQAFLIDHVQKKRQNSDSGVCECSHEAYIFNNQKHTHTHSGHK